MSALTNRNLVFQRLAQGLGMVATYVSTAPNAAATTAAAAASGGLTVQLHWNAIGSTLPGTRRGFPIPPGLTGPLRLILAQSQWLTRPHGVFLAWLYEIGTVNLAATGNQFTHHAATFPVRRTIYGVANSPVPLIPLLYVTTATATTAPVIRLRTAAGGAGYVNQDGTAVVGTKSFTFPAAATAVRSGFVLRLEDGDSAVRDISAIEVVTAGSAGAAVVFGAELLCPLGSAIPQPYLTDTLFAGPMLNSLTPAVATAGTAEATLALVCIGSTSSGGSAHVLSLQAVLDTS